MRPKPIVWFERALLVTVAIDLANNLIALPAISRGYALRGFALSQPTILALALIAPGLGLIFWYFIARRGSVIAKWLLAAYVALTVVIFFRQMTVTPLAVVNPMLIAAIVAALLKLFALLCLFMPSAQPWFDKERVA